MRKSKCLSSIFKNIRNVCTKTKSWKRKNNNCAFATLGKILGWRLNLHQVLKLGILTIILSTSCVHGYWKQRKNKQKNSHSVMENLHCHVPLLVLVCFLFLDIPEKNSLPNWERSSTVWALVAKRLHLIEKLMDQATRELVHCLSSANPWFLLRIWEKLSLSTWKSHHSQKLGLSGGGASSGVP